MSHRRLVIPEFLLDSLLRRLLPHPPERFAFGLARPHQRESRIDYVVEHVVFTETEDYAHQSCGNLALSEAAAAHFNRVSVEAERDGLVPLHIHSHPSGVPEFSACDDEHELATHRWLRSQGQPLLLSLVCPAYGQPQGRLWVEETAFPCALWAGLRPLNVKLGSSLPPALLRQAAFGDGLRQASSELRIGIVGLGGVGMLVLELLVRAGFQKFVLVDPDSVEETNLNRLPRTRARDVGKKKVKVAARLIRIAGKSVGTTPHVRTFMEDIYQASRRCRTALQHSDVLLALTDNHLSRIECLRLALDCGAIFLQAGVEILLDEEPKQLLAEISGAELGRYCPICAGRLHPGQGSLEARKYVGGEVLKHAQKNGYVPEVSAPSVMSLNSIVAGALVLELQRRMSGLGAWDLWQHDFNSGSTKAIEHLEERLQGSCGVCGRSSGL